MDEILIEGKKYVSSKQAAKITGYAKDYIGQLCREGRVSARLVGRSWYVLESAIQDHRFGSHDTPQKEVEEAPKVTEKTWEFPRYEAVQVESLPSVNRLQEPVETPIAEESSSEEREEDMVSAQKLHDSWKEWFDKTNQAQPPEVRETPETESEQEDREEALGEAMEDDEVSVPLRVVNPYAAPIDSVPEVAVRSEEVAVVEPARPVRRERQGTLMTGIQVGMVVIAIASVVFVAIANGYLNKYLISIKQVQEISGTSIYNKYLR